MTREHMDTFDASLPPLTPEAEAEMQKEIEIVLAPYARIVPASLFALLRRGLERTLRTHPVPRQMLRELVTHKS